jgi:hypothetical protein
MLRRRANEERRECFVVGFGDWECDHRLSAPTEELLLVALVCTWAPSTGTATVALAALDRRLCFLAAFESVAGSAVDTLNMVAIVVGLGIWADHHAVSEAGSERLKCMLKPLFRRRGARCQRETGGRTQDAARAGGVCWRRWWWCGGVVLVVVVVVVKEREGQRGRGREWQRLPAAESLVWRTTVVGLSSV